RSLSSIIVAVSPGSGAPNSRTAEISFAMIDLRSRGTSRSYNQPVAFLSPTPSRGGNPATVVAKSCHRSSKGNFSRYRSVHKSALFGSLSLRVRIAFAGVRHASPNHRPVEPDYVRGGIGAGAAGPAGPRRPREPRLRQSCLPHGRADRMVAGC